MVLPKGVYLPISMQRSNLAVANLLAHSIYGIYFHCVLLLYFTVCIFLHSISPFFDVCSSHLISHFCSELSSYVALLARIIQCQNNSSYYVQVISLQLKSNVASKKACKHLWGYNLFCCWWYIVFFLTHMQTWILMMQLYRDSCLDDAVSILTDNALFTTGH